MSCRLQAHDKRLGHRVGQSLRNIWSMVPVLAGLSLAGVSLGFAASLPHGALLPDQAPPGATVSIGGKGFGRFTSVHVNTVDPGIQESEVELD